VRCLIIGCGCRGQLLARALGAQGHAVRGTTRWSERLAEIEAAGAEAAVGDPDRVATLMGALDHVTVACILLASATGSPEQLRALHGPRLEMLLTKMVDTTVRGVVYEASGTVEPGVLARGARQVQVFGERSLARTAWLEADPERPQDWLPAALEAIERVVAHRS
jgi:nucleoside-diphosphate-sugar epimerase